MVENYYTFEEMCELLGIKRRTLSRWIKEGKFPYYKIGKRKWFEKIEIDNWIQKQKERKNDLGRM